MSECVHQWEECGFDTTYHSTTGIQVHSVLFCPQCKGFATKPKIFGRRARPLKAADVKIKQEEARREFCMTTAEFREVWDREHPVK